MCLLSLLHHNSAITAVPIYALTETEADLQGLVRYWTDMFVSAAPSLQSSLLCGPQALLDFDVRPRFKSHDSGISCLSSHDVVAT